MAVQKGSEGEVISNPPTDYQLEDDDYLIAIAEKKPQLEALPSSVAPGFLEN